MEWPFGTWFSSQEYPVPGNTNIDYSLVLGYNTFHFLLLGPILPPAFSGQSSHLRNGLNPIPRGDLLQRCIATSNFARSLPTH